MAVHPDLTSMLRESLPEYLYVANYCIGFTKDEEWPSQGCLGYPAAGLLFSILDTIGSYLRGQLSVKVDEKDTPIRNDGCDHFYILNSEYYGQSLPRKTIESLYKKFRSILLHNAALAPEVGLTKGGGSEPFPFEHGRQWVDLLAFLEISRRAVETFLARADSIVPGSIQAKNIRSKR